jgi:PTH2 family peptidyl-tRNA hydrolase
MSDTKQVIVMRKDLNMRKGKMIAQASHATMAFLTSGFAASFENAHKAYSNNKKVAFYAPPGTFSEVELDWINNSFTKICVYVESEEDLFLYHDAAQMLGIRSHLIQDAGVTEFHGVPTYTCLALGPDLNEKIDGITGELPLL